MAATSPATLVVAQYHPSMPLCDGCCCHCDVGAPPQRAASESGVGLVPEAAAAEVVAPTLPAPSLPQVKEAAVPSVEEL